MAANKTAPVNNFSSYVSREIIMSGAINTNSAVWVVLNPDGTMSPVPSQFKTENGKTVAVIKRMSNSFYTVVENKKAFADVAGHWAKDDINTLASKMIISGLTETAYAPENKITRAEFASLVVKALGLEPNAAKAFFNDVKPNEWYAGAVGAAVEAGIINGYKDGTFRPNAKVSRQEVAAMIVQALKVAGQDISGNAAETDADLAQVTDKTTVASSAKSAVAAAVKSGIIKGNTGGEFAPNRNCTRAESAVMIRKMLTKANFI